MMVRAVLRVCVAAFLCVAAFGASAQSYANKPIRLIVPLAAGGAADIVGRLLQFPLEKALGQPIVIENRPGASGTIGTEMVAKAPPDGHTLGISMATQTTVNPAVTSSMPYDTEKDLQPIVLVGKSPMMFVANAAVPAKTVGEFVALAKANPEKFNYATPGAASQAHLVIAYWSGLAGINIQHVPYKGGGPAMLSTVAGETQFTVMSTLLAAPHIVSGKVRALATGGLTRDPQFPDVPTMAELGYTDVEAVTWVGVYAPAGTPREIVQKLNSEIARIIREPDFKAKLDQQGLILAGGPPEELGKLISVEIKRWSDVARANKIAVDR
jgi:tripartite-type tricarboxylate transporter receptor subunit TctC